MDGGPSEACDAGPVARRTRQSWLLRSVTTVAVIACLTPIVTSVVDVGEGWVPVSDTAIIATRARDVFTTDSPLLGQPSTAGATVGRQVHHPGPLEYWVIAAAQQVGDRRLAPLLAIALVNAAAVLSILWWVRALGGTTAMVLAAVPLTTMLWSLRGEALVDPLNPLVAVVPFAAHLVALVAVARGRRWALLSAVLAGSWAAQAHLTVTGLVVASAAVAVAALAARRVRAGGGGWRTLVSKPVVLALVALVVCWGGPIIDVLSNGGGNVRALAATSGAVPAPPGSDQVAIDRAVQALTWRPVWADAGAWLPRLLTTPSDVDRLLVAALWLGGLVAAVLNRRRAPALGLAFAIASTVVLTGTALLSRLPGSFFNIFQAGNYLWLWPSGAMLWSASLAGLAVLVSARLPPPARSTRTGLLVLPLCVAVAFAVASVADPSHRTVQRAGPAYVVALGRDLDSSLDRSQTYGLDLSLDLQEQVVDVGLVLELERRGFDIRVPDRFEPSFGPSRATGLAGTGATLRVDLGREPPEPPGPEATLVSSYRPPASLSQRLDAAERDLAGRIDSSGGVERLIPQGFGLEVPETTLEFVQDDLLGMLGIGLLPRDVTAWPETRELVAVRALPVRHAAVHLLPAPPPLGDDP